MKEKQSGSGVIRILVFLLSFEAAAVVGLLGLFAFLDGDAGRARGVLLVLLALVAIITALTSLGLIRLVRPKHQRDTKQEVGPVET